jgi:hypothetical protein
VAKTCIKCGYGRRDSDTAPDYACPHCGVVYAKAEAAHARQQALAAARAAAQAEAAARLREAAASAPAPVARSDAVLQQVLLASAGEARKGGAHRGMALVALVAFFVGFASAAGLYSGMSKLQKPPPAANCPKA